MFIGIDVGSESLKVVVINEVGLEIASGHKSYTFETPRPGWTECHPDVWWSACLAVLRKLGERIDLGQVNAIGVTGQMHSAVLLDKGNSPIAKALLWNDQRSADSVIDLETRVPRTDIQRVTGNRLATGFTAAKLGWWRMHHPDVLTRVATVVMPKDYVVLRMTGQLGTDVSDASGTGVFNVTKRTWAKELIREFGFLPEWFPQSRESFEVAGRVLWSVAGKTGLCEGTPVLAGAADNAASAIGVGSVLPSTAMVSIGTSGVVLVPITDLHDPTEDELHVSESLHLFCHAVPNTWYRMGVTLSAGYSLQWFKRMLSSAIRRGTATEAETGPDRGGEVSFATLNTLAQQVESASEGLYFLPYLAGERTPLMNANARGVFFGLTASQDARHLVRAVMEGVGFSLKDSLALMDEIGLKPKNIQLTGGVVNSRVWSQLIADILGLPIRLRTGAGAAYGAAKLCLYTAGSHGQAGFVQAPSQVVRVLRQRAEPFVPSTTQSREENVVESSEVIQPLSVRVSDYSEYYKRYHAIVGTMKDLW